MKKITLRIGVFLFCILLSLGFSGCVQKNSDSSVNYLAEITALKTGKSDCIVIESQNRTILIDTADKDSGRKIARFLKNKNIASVDLLITTHFDKDHIGGFESLSERIEIKNIIQPLYSTNAEIYRNYIEKIKEKNINIVNAEKNLSFSVNDMRFEIYTANENFSNKNNMSLVTAVIHGNNKLLFAGDIEKERSEEILKNNIKKLENFDLLKIPHHGIYFEKEEIFLSAVAPKITIITNGEKMKTEKTENILKNLGSDIYHTKNGNLKFISDGNQIKFISEN